MGGVHVWLHQFLNVALHGDGQLHTLVTFTPGKWPTRTHRIGGWVGNKAWLDNLGLISNLMNKILVYLHIIHWFTYNTSIKLLYMFQALPCSSSGGLRRNCTYAASGIVTLRGWLSCAPVKKELVWWAGLLISCQVDTKESVPLDAFFCVNLTTNQ